VERCASSAALWGEDLTRLGGFADAVATHLARACRGGVRAALDAHLSTSAAPAH